MLTVGSLFAGIGGIDLGLERAGMRSVWQCEIDPYAVRVLEKHWPDVLRVRDIRQLGAGSVPWVDVVAGGFPCQGISDAGLRLGLADPRSHLWFEMLRVIRELRPRWVVVENVSALLVRGLDVVLGGLAASGYDAEWDCIPASAVGAPHRRDRVWLVAYPRGEQHEGPSSAQRGTTAAGLPQAAAGHAPGVEHVADPGGVGCERRPGSEGVRGPAPERSQAGREPRHGGGAPWGDWWLAEPDVGRVADGVPARVDRLRGLGNAVVPQVAEWIGRRILEHELSAKGA